MCVVANKQHSRNWATNPTNHKPLPAHYHASTLASMLIVELFLATFQLGLPVLLFSWWMMSRLYAAGHLSREQPSKELKSNLKSLKKSWKKDGTKAGYLEKRWMKFGGGFYGLTALLTFVWIEASEAVYFIFHFPGLAVLLENGIINLLVDTLVNQIKNFVAAIVWVTYWPTNNSYIGIWIAVPYASYFTGLKLACLDLQSWQDRLKSKFSR
jgi:hypothetical protein